MQLIARGVANAEAYRIVGINRRTGTCWRFGRTITSSSGKSLHYAPGDQHTRAGGLTEIPVRPRTYQRELVLTKP